jgi:hypothetical protein
MQCNNLTPKNEARVLVCARRAQQRNQRQQCACGGPADLLCDFPSSRGGTCDAYICQTCALHLTTAPEDLDFCAAHAPFVFSHADLRLYVVNNHSVGEGELIDRSTPLGNPFRLSEGVDTPKARTIVLDKYRKHLWKQMLEQGNPVRVELARLLKQWQDEKQLILRCWCTPRLCHGQVIARALIYCLKLKQAQETQ